MPQLSQSGVYRYTTGTPIYYIFAEYPRANNGYPAMIILHVEEMFIEDLMNNTIIAQEMVAKYQQYYSQGKSINTYTFAREPNNPFRNWNGQSSSSGNISQGQNFPNAGSNQKSTDTGLSSKNTGQQKSVDDEIQEAIQNADYTSGDAW